MFKEYVDINELLSLFENSDDVFTSQEVRHIIMYGVKRKIIIEEDKE